MLLARPNPGAARRVPAPLPPPRLPEAAAPRFSRRHPRSNPGARGLAGPRSSHPSASACRGRHARLLGVRSSPASLLRRAGAPPGWAGIPPALVDSRGGNCLPGVTGTGGGDSPAGMTRWAGIPPSEAHRRQNPLERTPSPGALTSETWGSWEKMIQGDGSLQFLDGGAWGAI